MKTVTVLMSTYNGEKYLNEQTQSLISQKNVDINILVRDDSSSDATRDILESCQNNGILKWYKGENLKSARSFLNLVKNAPDSDYYAFCDQDDVWYPDKLEKAVTKLDSLPPEVPALYCANYQLTDAKLNPLPDNGHVSTTKFNESIVTSNCTGCTTVFNRKLKEFLQIGVPNTVVMHDDWAHKVCLAVGGCVIYDSDRVLMHRQHGSNVDGGIHTLKSRLRSVVTRINKKDCERSGQLREIIRLYGDKMPSENLKLAQRAADYKDKGLLGRLNIAFSHEFNVPYKKARRGFMAAVIFGYY